MWQALLEMLKQKMKEVPDADPGRVSVAGEETPPPRKKMKMIDFRYTRFGAPTFFSSLAYCNTYVCAVCLRKLLRLSRNVIQIFKLCIEPEFRTYYPTEASLCAPVKHEGAWAF